MKTLFYLSTLLLFVTSCTFFNKTKNTTKEEQPETMAEGIDTTNIPTAFSMVDSTLRIVDTAEMVEIPPEPTEPLDFMTIEEWEMINEINLLRGDPVAYLRFVDEYIEDFVRAPGWSAEDKQQEMAAANELRYELKNMEPRNALYPYYKLHQIAVMHGEDMKKMEVINHTGSDGSQPYQRIRKNSELDGTENLVGGHATVRESVISLLVDGGISNRGHRRNLLNDHWQYIACNQVGTVAEIDNVWIQLFAFDDPNEEKTSIPDKSIPMAPEEEKLVAPEEKKLSDKVNEVSMKTASPDIQSEAAIKADKASDSAVYPFLTKEEQSMVDEINLMRSNPSGYIQYVDEYAKKNRDNGFGADPQFEAAVNELKDQLTKMAPLGQLKPHEKLYAVAKAHGLDNKKNNQLEHTGSDGSDPFERVKRSGLKNHIDEQGYFSPNENLVGGETTIRNAVLALLIDAGIPNRGHRRALIDPNWEYVACYKIGLIENLPELRGSQNDDMDHCWVQLFAKD